jgi:hypothetical protein
MLLVRTFCCNDALVTLLLCVALRDIQHFARPYSMKTLEALKNCIPPELFFLENVYHAGYRELAFIFLLILLNFIIEVCNCESNQILLTEKNEFIGF